MQISIRTIRMTNWRASIWDGYHGNDSVDGFY